MSRANYYGMFRFSWLLRMSPDNCFGLLCDSEHAPGCPIEWHKVSEFYPQIKKCFQNRTCLMPNILKCDLAVMIKMSSQTPNVIMVEINRKQERKIPAIC